MTGQMLLNAIRTALLATPPDGYTRAEIRDFFEKFGDVLSQAFDEELRASRNVPPGGFPADLDTPGARTKANVRALRLLARGEPYTDAERYELGLYSGWGGLSLRKAQKDIPQGWEPEERGLLHEFYTPSNVWRAVARLCVGRSWVRGGTALEPSAGVGRALAAFGEVAPNLRWTALEASRISAAILRARYPEATVVEGFAERFFATNRTMFDLVAANPPYGTRGSGAEHDPTGYRTAQAYVYFLIRGLEALKEGGTAIYIIPTGLLDSRTGHFERYRSDMLLRAHLQAAFRLPSQPPEGGDWSRVGYPSFPVDVLFLRGRGGIARANATGDAGIIQGDYYAQNPGHILGVTVTNDDEGPKVRRGMQVVGQFDDFPGFEERRMQPLEMGAGRRVSRAAGRGGITREDERGLLPADAPASLLSAEALGRRVDGYLLRRATGAAILGGAEIAADLQAWRDGNGDPFRNTAIKGLVEAGNVFLARFLSAMQMPRETWRLTEPPYSGPRTIYDLAEHVYRRRGGLPLPLDVLEKEARAVGVVVDDDVGQRLWDAGWRYTAEDRSHMLPGAEYRVGDLWRRWDAIVNGEGPDLATQREELRAAIGFVGVAQILEDSAPNQPWVPVEMLRDFLNEKIGWPGIDLTRDKAMLLMPVNVGGYGALNNTEKARTYPFDRDQLCFIGWVNSDKMLFVPEQQKRPDPDTGEPKAVPIEETRAAMVETWLAHWRDWIVASERRMRLVETAYNRTMRGYVVPPENDAPIDVTRWNNEIQLHDYQRVTGNKVLAQGSGLVALDVGLGKTYTAIKVLAKMRQEGRARRPVVLVPNTIAWKWKRDFAKCLPDYRVGVVGSNRWRVWRDGGRKKLTEEEAEANPGKWRWKSDTDSPSERAQKWAEFQAGAYDVMIVTYSAFLRQKIDEDFCEDYIAANVAIRRQMTMALEERAKENEAKKENAGKRTERGEAELRERTRAWLAAKLAPPSTWAYDPGVDWHALNVDLLVVDEAQNFKNLYYSEMESSADAQAAKRAWALDFRCASVRAHTGGGGIVLLSATPMKNAAAEFFSMLHFINPRVWEQVGLGDPETFMSMFARVETRTITTGEGKRAERSVVVGFRNLEALRGVVYRWSHFKTAGQVGLKIPDVTRTMHVSSPTEAQKDAFASLFAELAEIEQKIKDVFKFGRDKKDPRTRDILRALRMKKQGVHTRLYLCALHPSMVLEGKQYAVATAGPKLVQCADVVMAISTKVCEEPIRSGAWAARACDDPAEADGITGRGCSVPSSGFCLDCGHVIFVENPEVHTYMVELLVARGVPKERIAVLNAITVSDLAERQAIAERFNGFGRPGDEDYEAPEYDIVIANSVAYEGVDLQRHTCAIHHLDVPWEPATLQQRNGRGVRQGNLFGSVSVHFYFVAGSSEEHRLGKIERKRGIMSSLFEGGAVGTNTVQAETVEADVSVSDAFINLCPPELREQIAAAAAEERARIEEESRRAARVAANRAAEVYLRAVVAERMEPDEARREEAAARRQAALETVNNYSSGLWEAENYSWHKYLRRGAEVHGAVMPMTGPCLFSGAIIRVGRGPARTTLGEMEQPVTEEILDDNVKVVVASLSGGDYRVAEAYIFVPEERTGRFYKIPVNGSNALYGVNDPAIAWNEDDFEAFFTTVTPTVPNTWGPGYAFHRWGRVAAPALWRRWEAEIRRDPSETRRWAYPYLRDGRLRLQEERQWEVVRIDELFPPTEDGWLAFLDACRNHRTVPDDPITWKTLGGVTAMWWQRSMPYNVLGTNHRGVPEPSRG